MYFLTTNFVVVIAVQLVTLVIVAFLTKAKARTLLNRIPLALLCGVIIGLFFDFLVGKSAAVFDYVVPLTLPFAIMNGLFSYGTAILTAEILPVKFISNQSIQLRRLLLFVFGMLSLGIICLTYRGHVAFLSALGSGLVLMGLTEVLLVLWRRQTGPLGQCLMRHGNAFLSLWLWSVVIGTIYESANLVFHLWRWHIFPGNDTMTIFA
ncbi:MAG TPA: hypothetical protein VMC06_07530, partial [Opitutaceae bacterium]|nr:hypothetical protein [Opitutaceae bacterium]